MSTAAAAPEVSRRGLLGELFKAAPAAAVWQEVEGLSAGSGDVFWSGCACDGEVFVVGDEGAVFRYAAGAWRRETVPVPVPIHAIWGPTRDRLSAVGWMGAVFAYDGEAWTLQRGCAVGEDGKYAAVPENTPLFDLTGDDAGTLWAVGDDGTILACRSGVWTGEDSGTRAHLRAITRLPDGRLLAAGGDGTVLLRDAAGRWQSLDCPVGTGFQAALTMGPDHVLLAGGRYFIDANGFRGDLLRWRDGDFEPLKADEPLSRLRALAATRDGALAVGDKGRIYAVRGERIDRLESPTGHDLMGIVSLPGDETLVVGDFGTVLTAAADVSRALAAPTLTGTRDLPAWEPMVSPTDRQLWGLWADRANDRLYACGEEGTVLRLDGCGSEGNGDSGGTWERLPPVPGGIGLHDLCDAGDGGLLAAGQLGEIHHFDGARWRKHFDLMVDVTILALWSDGAGQVFAVGDEGLVLRWDGRAWQRMTSGTKSALYGVWGLDADHLLAVGDFGMVLRWNGTRWDEFHAGTDSFLFDVWGDALDNIFVVGLSGTIGQFDGRRWQLTPGRVRADLLALSGGPTGTYAVGTGGAALRYDGRGWQPEVTGFDGGLRAVSAGPQGVVAAGDGGALFRRQPQPQDAE